MRRVQLVELEDLPWLPAPVRDAATALLDVMTARLALYDGATAAIAGVLAATGSAALIDLCSGSGGPASRVRDQLAARGQHVTLMLTDLYPSAVGIARADAAGDAAIQYVREPVNAATGGPAGATGVRTMFGALHHFPPAAVHDLVAGLVARRAPCCLVDIAASPVLRRLPVVAALPLIAVNALMVVIVALRLAPLARPIRPLHLVLTYLPPIVPFVFAWDGTVSALRAYTPDEVVAIARGVPGADGYDWQGTLAGKAWVVTGVPRVVDGGPGPSR